MSELELPESPYVLKTANLRQAVEWIAYGLKPIPREYEAVLRKVEKIQNSDKKEIDNAKRLLVLALMEDRLFAHGEMISGDDFHVYQHPCWHALHWFNWDFNHIQWDKNEIFSSKKKSHSFGNATYGNITFKFKDLVETFPKFYDLEVQKLLEGKKSEVDPEIDIRPNYLSPYMKLLDLAVKEFNITSTNQPATKILVDWFFNKLKEIPGEIYSSMTKAKMLATFVREPNSQKGGLKKLDKNNSK